MRKSALWIKLMTMMMIAPWISCLLLHCLPSFKHMALPTDWKINGSACCLQLYNGIVFRHILSVVGFSTADRLTDVIPLIACPCHVEHVVKYGADPFVSTDRNVSAWLTSESARLVSSHFVKTQYKHTFKDGSDASFKAPRWSEAFTSFNRGIGHY